MSDHGEEDAPLLQALAKHINDLQHLVTMLSPTLSLAKPWQRQLAAHLKDVDRQLEVFRLVIAMEKGEVEILAAAAQVLRVARLATAALSGSRADSTTRAAVRLICDLAGQVHSCLTTLHG